MRLAQPVPHRGDSLPILKSRFLSSQRQRSVCRAGNSERRTYVFLGCIQLSASAFSTETKSDRASLLSDEASGYGLLPRQFFR